MTTHNTPNPNPYVGPRAFRKGEKIYGRDREVRDLLDLLIAERIVLLHSPSGAGKSSLVQAGLIPALEAEGFQVLPVARVNLEPPASIKQDNKFNRYAFSALLSLEEPLPEKEQSPIERLASLTLADYLSQKMEEAEEVNAEVLIFDQFEEILTVDPTDQEGKARFFAQLGDALRDHSRWGLVSLREDFVAALNPYLRPVPTRFANTYRLDLLGKEAAHQAIRQPAQDAGVDFQESAAQKLIDDLRRVLVQHPDGSTEEQPGPYVEPVQLQVVCYRLWDNLPPEEERITLKHLKSVGDVDQSLADYYAERVAGIGSETGVSQRAIRQWVERELITEGGFRGQVLMGDGSSQGLDNRAVRLMEDAHIVRAEKRRGATWFELAHDRLIKPVRDNNARWAQENLSLLQRQATLWEGQNRSETLLLRDKPLEEAERWAKENPDELSQIDQEFLEACLEERERLEAARRAAERERQLKLEAAQKLAEAESRRAEEQAQAASRLRRRAYILGAVLIIAVVMAGLALLGQRAARAQERLANQQRSTAQAASNLADQNALQAQNNAATAQVASTLANDNAIKAQDNAATAQAASTIAVAQQATAEYNAQVAHEQQALAQTQANIARSRELASLALTFLRQNSTLTLLLSKEALDISNTGQALDALLRGLQRNLSRRAERYEQFIPPQQIGVYALAASPDGTMLAWGGTDGLVRAWDMVDQQEMWFKITNDGATVNDLTFNPDGSYMIAGDANGELSFLDNQTGERIRNLPSNITGINRVTFSADGSTLAYGGLAPAGSANVYTINLDTTTYQSFLIKEGEVAEVLALALSPDGKLLAAGGRDRIVHIWDTATGQEVETLKDILVDNTLERVYQGPIRGLAFSPDGKWLATGAEDNEGPPNRTLLVWDASAWTEQEPLAFENPRGDMSDLIFSPDGQTLAAGFRNGTTTLWNFNSQQLIENLENHTGQVEGMAFSQFEDSLLLASGGLDRRIVLSNLIDLQSLSSPLISEVGTTPRLAVGEDGRLRIVSQAEDGLNLWDMEANNMPGQPVPLDFENPDGGYYLSPNGKRLALVRSDGQIEVHNMESGDIHSIAIPMTSVVREAENSTSERPAVIDSLAFSPDGGFLAGGICAQYRVTVNADTNVETETCVQNSILLWDIITGALRKQIPTRQSSPILSLAFEPQDGNLLAAGYGNSAIQFWDLSREEASGLPLLGQGGPVTSLAFHLDGDILASASENSLIALWNVSPPQLLGNPLAGSDGSVVGLAFSRDTNSLYSASEKGTILSWKISEWKHIACTLAEGNLTLTEWRQFFPNQEYRATCPEYPLETPTPTAAPATASPPSGVSTPTPTATPSP